MQFLCLPAEVRRIPHDAMVISSTVRILYVSAGFNHIITLELFTINDMLMVYLPKQ